MTWTTHTHTHTHTHTPSSHHQATHSNLPGVNVCRWCCGCGWVGCVQLGVTSVAFGKKREKGSSQKGKSFPSFPHCGNTHNTHSLSLFFSFCLSLLSLSRSLSFSFCLSLSLSCLSHTSLSSVSLALPRSAIQPIHWLFADQFKVMASQASHWRKPSIQTPTQATATATAKQMHAMTKFSSPLVSFEHALSTSTTYPLPSHVLHSAAYTCAWVCACACVQLLLCLLRAQPWTTSLLCGDAGLPDSINKRA